MQRPKVEKYGSLLNQSYAPRVEEKHKPKAPPITLKTMPIYEISTFSKIPGVPAQFLEASTSTKAYETKIYLPKFTGVNYIGLIMGPKGIY